MRNKLITRKDIEGEPWKEPSKLKRLYWKSKDWVCDLVPKKVKYKYWELVEYDYRPMQIYYRTKCFLFKRYSTVKPRTLGHTWCDRCTLLPHMMFEILSNFVEKEGVDSIVQWYGENPHTVLVNGVKVNVMDEMLALYNWWHLKYLKAYPQIEEAWYDKLQQFNGKSNWDTEVKNDKDEVYAYEWKMEFPSEEDEEAYDKNIRLIFDMEAIIHNELVEKMNRLNNIHCYMWT